MSENQAKWRKWQKKIYEHYTQSPATIFPRFKLGASLFLAGLVVIYGASQLLEPSLTQEIFTLLGLIIIIIGFMIAMMVQVRMLIGRILRFFFED